MDKFLEKINNELNEEINNLRNLLYFLEQKLFERLYKECSEIARAEIELAIKRRNKDEIKRWFDEQRSRNLNTMTLCDLRERARGLNVYGWHRLNKDQLTFAILRKGKDENSGRSGTSGPQTRKNENRTTETVDGGKS